MNPILRRLLFWAPRVLCVLFIVFVSMFALDVFGEGRGFWRTLLALLIHLIPTGVLVLILAVTWRWEWVGGILFPALGALYMLGGRVHWSAYVMLSGPLFLLGALFLLGWIYRAQLRARS
jgi:hypothetical protein